MTDRLSSYGYAFQIKVITSLLTDKSFLQQISDILNLFILIETVDLKSNIKDNSCILSNDI